MRVAALYDIHGNLPALDTALEEIRRADVDRIVVGGEVVPGPMPRETIARLLDLETPVDRRTRYPQAQAFAERNVLQPPSEEEMLAAFSS